jgi:hypothetical protein
MRTHKHLTTMLLFVAALCGAAHAQPLIDKLNVQGFLQQSNGGQVTDGSYHMAFAVEQNGTYFWGVEQNVAVSKGLFSVSLSGAAANLTALAATCPGISQNFVGTLNAAALMAQASGEISVHVCTVDPIDGNTGLQFDIPIGAVPTSFIASTALGVAPLAVTLAGMDTSTYSGTFHGAGDTGKFVALNASGLIDTTFLPTLTVSGGVASGGTGSTTGSIQGSGNVTYQSAAGGSTTVGNNTTIATTIIQSGTGGITETVTGTSGNILMTAGTTTGSVTISGGSSGNSTFGSNSGASSTTIQSGTGGILLAPATGGTVQVSQGGINLVNGLQSVTVYPSATMTGSYNFVLPINGGSSNQFLMTDGTGTTSWGSAGALNGTNSWSGTQTYTTGLVVASGQTLTGGLTLGIGEASGGVLTVGSNASSSTMNLNDGTVAVANNQAYATTASIGGTNSASTSAVNIGNGSGTGTPTLVIGQESNAGAGHTAITLGGTTAVANTGVNTLDIGKNLTSSSGTVALTLGNVAGTGSGANSVAIGGVTAAATGPNSVAIGGVTAAATGANTIDIGKNTSGGATGSTTITIGNNSTNTNYSSTVSIGVDTNSSTGATTVNIGNGTSTTATTTTNIGSSSQTANSVVIQGGLTGGVMFPSTTGEALTVNSGNIITTATPGTATGLSLPTVPGSTIVRGRCVIIWQQATAVSTATFAVATSAAPTGLWVTSYTAKSTATAFASTLTTINSIATTAVQAAVAPSAIATNQMTYLDFMMQTAATPVTLSLWAWSGAAADAVTVRAGSYCGFLP